MARYFVRLRKACVRVPERKNSAGHTSNPTSPSSTSFCGARMQMLPKACRREPYSCRGGGGDGQNMRAREQRVHRMASTRHAPCEL